MKWCERILLIAWLGFCFAMMTEGALWAGDCQADSDDCKVPPDNNSRAAVGGGVLAGGGMALRGHRKKRKSAPPAKKRAPDKPDPCAAEKQALQDAQGQLAADKGQRDHYAQEVNQFATNLGDSISRAQQLISRIRDIIGSNDVNVLIGADLPWGWADPGGMDNMTTSQWQTLGNRISKLQGADIQSDVQEFVGLTGNIVSDMTALNNAKQNWSKFEDAYEEDLRAITDAQSALDDCLASQQSTGGDAGAGDSASVPS